MNGLIRWFATNRVAANLLMLLIGLAGLKAILVDLDRELFPEISLDVVRVSVVYPGATPSEVEDGIVLRIEEAVSDLPGIDAMTSTAAEGVGSVTLEVIEGIDVRDLLDDVKSRIDSITSFPEDAEEPRVEAPSITRRVTGLALHGDLDRLALRRLAEGVRDDLLAIEGITQVALAGVPGYEIGIQVSESDLRRYGLGFDEIRRAIVRASLDLPAGTIKRRGGEILLRSEGQAFNGRDYAELVLRTDEAGGILRLGDVAEIHDGLADEDLRAEYAGDPAVLLQVFQVGDQDILGIARAVGDYLETARARLPPGVGLAKWEDTSELYQDRMDTLERNAVGGLVLVFLALALFLRLRLAIWVSIGIPIAFLGALWVMPIADASLNMISMFAFILVLGIVVDDAIIVGEAIHTDQDAGRHGESGAISGAVRVAKPVLFAVVTSMMAFAPMLFVSGTDGRFWRIIPIVVIGCLAFSLIESLLVLPAHLSHQPRPHRRARLNPLRWIGALNDQVDRLLFGFIDRIYRPFLRAALAWRYLALSAFVTVLLLTLGLVGAGIVRWIGFPQVAGDSIRVSLEMPTGTDIETTEGVAERIADAVAVLRAEFDAQDPERPVIGDLLVTIGATPASAGFIGRGGGTAAGNVAELVLTTPNLVARGVGVAAISRRWQEVVGDIPGIESLGFISDLSGGGSALSIRLTGADLDHLRAASAVLRHELAAIDGVYRVQDDFSDGKEQFTLRITEEAQLLGLSLEDLARQVRGAFFGVEVQRILRGRDELKVMVRYPERERENLQALYDMRIRTPAGDAVPFSRVATVETGISPPLIKRRDRARLIQVEGEVDGAVSDTATVNALLEDGLLPAIERDFPGVATEFGGETERHTRAMDELYVGALAALFAMYALMAVAFRSYLQPALIMTAIPFGVVGAILGHWILGMQLSMLSLMGIIALAGVVVNDNLVLVDEINRRLDRGASLRDAVVLGAASRFRAVLLTTLTTFLGLVPLMLETSVQAQFLIPMAVALAFGVVFASTITLVLVPVIYLVLEDLRWVTRWVFCGPETRDGTPD